MIRDLDDPDPNQRGRGNECERFCAKARSAAGRIEAMLDDPSPVVRARAAVALFSIDPMNTLVLPSLMNALDSTEVAVLDDAIAAITKLGPGGAEAAPKLTKIISRMDLTDGGIIGEELAYEVCQTKALRREGTGRCQSRFRRRLDEP